VGAVESGKLGGMDGAPQVVGVLQDLCRVCGFGVVIRPASSSWN
jgi:hypothetical protein